MKTIFREKVGEKAKQEINHMLVDKKENRGYLLRQKKMYTIYTLKDRKLKEIHWSGKNVSGEGKVQKSGTLVGGLALNSRSLHIFQD